ncbi:response regulator containing a CheY-like receiver domain and a GGDEF domain [Synechococcus sp. PCC 7502]|uniref:response regulator transcription factor n=1 Tax=Synechococcus sp. PCC 7502 TaxID=1173263 RepID=UPI00029FF60A|nr:response regulator [Synechococcus sp. PCC 7502]AFY73516.1 response regulator containing a CheY-like receiver domain and a GGDEF domain [Synechococcus sp. PCC 7502]
MSKILVVEDSQAQRETIINILKSHKFEIATAKNGVEAIAQAKSIQPDVIILDIVMPGMNGYEICRQLRDNPLTSHIRIAICSTKSTKVDRYWGFKQGANAYIIKPFSTKDLVDTVHELLPSQSRNRQKVDPYN